MKVERFEDIESWKEARSMVKEVYGQLRGCRDFGFRDQIQRASISIMSCIAEGFDRHSNKEMIHYLVMSRGSASEVRSLAYAGLDIGYFSEKQFADLMERTQKISGLLNGLIRYLRNSQRTH
jgi:four helix bundle protein